MPIEHKQLYRFILGAFKDNEAVMRFLNKQPDYGEKLVANIPNPSTDREDYAFHAADRLVRWGYSGDYLEAVIADATTTEADRAQAEAMLGRTGIPSAPPRHSVAVISIEEMRAGDGLAFYNAVSQRMEAVGFTPTVARSASGIRVYGVSSDPNAAKKLHDDIRVIECVLRDAGWGGKISVLAAATDLITREI
jgi:hypothetical protein